jgi:hypothetical protein
MQIKDGGNCWAKVECADGSTEYKEDDKDWSQCKVGGENKFKDSRIGEWNVTFKERDGAGQGDGLTTPALKMKVSCSPIIYTSAVAMSRQMLT